MIYDSHMDTPSQLLRLRNVDIDNKYGHVDFPKLRGSGRCFLCALYAAPDGPGRRYKIRSGDVVRNI